jgi:hypothetical protein
LPPPTIENRAHPISLTPEQVVTIGAPLEGPYRATHYRY